MEAAISSQVGNLIRCATAFIIIYMVLPAIIFSDSGDSILERFFSRYVRMVAVTIIMGYILVALKLYEVLSISLVFLIFVILFRVPANHRKHVFRKMNESFLARIFDFLDSPYNDRYQLFRQYLTQKVNNLKSKVSRYSNLHNAITSVLFLSVLAYSAYLRFYDTLRHAALAMSDSYVHLAWMKYIDGRILFHDGIYPMGFHIYLSILHKFSACDALYILKYTGSFSGVLMTVGTYLLVVKVTGRKLSGIIGAFVFGVLGGFLPGGWDRQSAPLSQEFAMIFLFPAWYYALVFMKTRKQQYLWTAAAAFAIIGFVHSLVLVFLLIGLVCLISAYLLLNFKQTIRSVWYLILAGIIAGIVATMPMLIAWLAGMQFHGATLEAMAVLTPQLVFPNRKFIDILALSGFMLFFLCSVWQRKARSDLEMPLFIFFFGLSSFFMYFFLGPVSGYLIFMSRMGALWFLVAPMGIGVGAEALLRIIPGKQTMLRSSVTSVITLFVMIWVVIYLKPPPALPYKMQYDAEINQYLRIVNEYPPAEWTLVSAEEGYDLALGKGWHIQLEDFLKWYDPQKSKLVRNVNGIEEPLIAKNLFIFYQKKLFKVNVAGMESILARRVQNYATLEQWVSKYRATHNNLSVFYQDDFIEIYYIH